MHKTHLSCRAVAQFQPIGADSRGEDRCFGADSRAFNDWNNR